MNEPKQKQLFAAVRASALAEVPNNFSTQVVSAIRQAQSTPADESLFEQFSALFPRLVAMALIVIFAAGGFEFWAGGDMATELAEASDQWLLPIDWL